APEANKALLQRFVEDIMNQQNLELIDELFAADYVMHTALSPVEVRGPEGLKQMLGMYAVVFPDAQVTIEDTVAEEDQVVFRFTLTGTHNGELMGIPPTGRHITMTGISVHRFADGKFAETWASDDALGMIQQLTAEEWSIDGPWITSLPTPMGNMIVKATWIAQDAAKTRFTGEFEQISVLPVALDLYPDLEAVRFAGALAVKTGLNQYEMTAIEYFTKISGPSHEEIIGIAVVAGSVQLVGPDLAQGQGTGAYYLASQDGDQDGFPDDGEAPALCVPWQWTTKRLTMMPGCVPTPLPE
ncbi:MAG: ester cyclase, partial [Phycisphaerales bacterium]